MIDLEQEFQSIAIVGMTGQFPGAKNLTEFWQNICAGKESIARLDEATLAARKVPEQRYRDPRFVNCDTSLEGMEWFDAQFFDLNAREANATDPQHRMLLEQCHRLLRVIATDPTRYEGDIGLFTGVGMSQYLLHNLMNQPDILDYLGEGALEIGNFLSYASSRVAHRLNLTGPVMALDTACSSSLVAVHLACKSLLAYECDTALAGGVQLNLPQRSGYLYNEGAFHSADGHCYTFDARANGTVFCSGVGLVALKRLEDALDDGDNIIAMIKGSAINNDGSDKVGYTAPAAAGQAEVIAKAQAFAEVDAQSIGYIEAHGTATALGDLIEFSALTEAFSGVAQGSCVLGSVKPNIGHTETAAGVAGLIKAALMLQHQQLPPSANFVQPNPEIDFENSPFKINTSLQPWLPGAYPRRAGISSFGIGGSNAHVVLEEFNASPASEPQQDNAELRPQLLLLSAKNHSALDTLRTSTRLYLEERAVELADFSWSLQQGSPAYASRHFVVAKSQAEAVAQLSAPAATSTLSVELQNDLNPIFMFPGQGAQHLGMAAELYRHVAVFRNALDECAEHLLPWLEMDIRTVLYANDNEAQRLELLNSTAITQPVLFAVEYSMAQVWLALGIQPTCMIGHSLGEFVAACLAGVFDLPTALMLVSKRAKLMQACPRGEMLAVAASAQQAMALRAQLPADAVCDLAAINAPDSCVLSGDDAAISTLVQMCAQKHIKAQRLHTSHAFHSAMMTPCLREFEQIMSSVTLRAPTIPFISNLTQSEISAEQATDPQYWCRHLRETVNFAGGLSCILRDPNALLLEIGPGQQLSQLALRHSAIDAQRVVNSQVSKNQEIDSDSAFIQAVGRLWLANLPIDWDAFYSEQLFSDGQQPAKVALPDYPYQPQRYWVDPQGEQGQVSQTKRQSLDDWIYVPQWQRQALPLLQGEQKQAVLVVSDHSDLAAQLKLQLGDQGTLLSLPENPALATGMQPWRDYFRELEQLGAFPEQILYLATQIEQSPEPQLTDFYGLLFMAQALAEHSNLKTDLIAISRGVFEVCGEPVTAPHRAMLSGVTKVLGQEVSGLRCRHLDLSEESDVAKLAHQVLAECRVSDLASQVLDDVVALRQGHRWTRRYDPYPITQPNTASLPFKVGGAYLIAGGFGGLGSTIAHFLANEYQATLILTSRREMPVRSEWAAHLADPQSPWHSSMTQIQALQRAGSKVLTVCADLSEPASVQRAVAQVKADVGQIHGVIHAAGVAGSGIAQLKTPQQAEQVLAPKVTGAWHLLAQFAPDELEFFIFNSSLFALTGGIGQVDYSAANAALDALACYARQQGFNAYSVNWDGWQQVGMAAQLEGWDSDLGISPGEGIELLKRVLVSQQAQLAIATRDLDWLIANAVKPVNPEAPLTINERPDIDTEYQAPLDECEQSLSQIWQKYLGLKSVGVADNFFELGGNSLILSEVLTDINQSFNKQLTITDLFRFTSIRSLAEFINSQQDSHDSADELRQEAQRRKQQGKRKRKRRGGE
ncbi:type I polyketide synthase [Pseudoalteromonas ardens]|nr:type I polyketide synthase [Pseudoalteromonas sp. R96]MDK1314044.1 SDR family NAD(P)-dependent oxidoreductase [Pseudoalteromonas sp. R96]